MVPAITSTRYPSRFTMRGMENTDESMVAERVVPLISISLWQSSYHVLATHQKFVH